MEYHSMHEGEERDGSAKKRLREITIRGDGLALEKALIRLLPKWKAHKMTEHIVYGDVWEWFRQPGFWIWGDFMGRVGLPEKFQTQSG